MSNKIALISPHDEPNHGTMLQAYALARAIEYLGFKAEYVSYKRNNQKNIFEKLLYYSIRPIKIIRWLQTKLKKNPFDDYSFFQTIEFQRTMQEFEKFYQEKIPHSAIVYSSQTIKNIEGYTKYIVGSDQTWSPFLYTSHSINFLDFVKNNSLKNAYAPSLGTTNIPKWFQKILQEKLSDFANLSCREKTNCKLIEDVTGKKVMHVIDPTLLITPMQWDTLLQSIEMPEKYVLCYILGEKKCISDFAEMLGANKNIPVYYIVTRPIYLQKKNNLKGIGPSQFIFLIKHATYVVTDSFHGSLFSINYNRNFYCFTKRNDISKNNDNDRIINMLNDFELTQRFKTDNDMCLEEDISFDTINTIIASKRKESYTYLKRIVK